MKRAGVRRKAPASFQRRLILFRMPAHAMELRRGIQIALLVGLWPASGLAGAAPDLQVPEGFLGHWGTSAADCHRGTIGGYLLARVDAFDFRQGFGRLVSTRRMGERELELEMAMTGEARGRVERRIYGLSSDRLTLMETAGPPPGTVTIRTRCAGTPLPPVDEGAADERFGAFRTQLLQAIDRKDKAFILSMVSADILNSFGGDGGIAEFEREWRLDRADSPFWKEFGTVLRMGGGFAGPDSFTAPYVSSHWPPHLDAVWHVAATGSDVAVRAAALPDAAVIATVSHKTAPHVGRHTGESEWLYVGLDDGRAGYIHKTSIRSAIDYRARFSRRDGRWWLDAFVAGD